LKNKKAGQTHPVEEEEGGLMLTKTSKLLDDAHPAGFKFFPPPTTTMQLPTISSSPHDSVHLIEDKVFAHLGEDEVGRSTTRWVVDIGVTNHMMGVCTTFIELDINVWGTVRFSDVSVIRIEG
jgi:hypothetical protein